MAIGARQRDVIAQPEIQSQFGLDLPVVLREKAILIIRGGGPELDFIVASCFRLIGISHQETGHGVAAAVRRFLRAGGGAVLVEGENATGALV